MSLAQIDCRAHVGLDAPLVRVEVHFSHGLPHFLIVGLPEKAVQESKERVRCALQQIGFDWPARRITVNLAPADLPKQGGRFDLPIALGILAAAGQVDAQRLKQAEFYGELSLSARINFVPALLPALLKAYQSDHCVFFPQDNSDEACLIQGLKGYAVSDLAELVSFLNGQSDMAPYVGNPPEADVQKDFDLAEVKGQAQAKRALLIAAAGQHHILFSGPPGSGKSMLANRLPGILPPLNEQEALEQALIRSISEQPPAQNWRRRPFRSPHHTASATALVGGGTYPKPGEISLAHQGVLFLDELPEFSRSVLEVLREPLENGWIEISRAKQKMRFPAQFQLVAAMNPCPCGYYGSSERACRCTPNQIKRYQDKLSGPLLDRIDIQVHVPNQANAILWQSKSETPSSELRVKVMQARQRQIDRQGCANAHLSVSELEKQAGLGRSEQFFLNQALNRLGLSARAYHKVLRIARSIADLAGEEQIKTNHLSEAIAYRRVI